MTKEIHLDYRVQLLLEEGRSRFKVYCGRCQSRLEIVRRLKAPTQEVRAKRDAHVAGLGVGFLPQQLAAPLLASGKLVALKVEMPRPDSSVCVAWRPNRTGRALRWFIQQFEHPEVVANVLASA